VEFSSLFNSLPRRYPELAGKIAVVTGSGRGIGKGIAVRLAREGVRVVVNSRTIAAVRQTVDELHSVGAEAVGVPTDLSTDDGIRELFRVTEKEFGLVDILINNAANLKRAHIFEVERDLLDNELDTNVRGAYLCAQTAAAQMRDRGGGRIVNVSSVGGLRAHWRGLPYDVTKGAMDAMTRAMALELAEYGVLVNAVAPGATYNKGLHYDEDQPDKVRRGVPLMRLSDPLEMGGVVAFLVSDDAGYITGQVLYVDGGLTTQLGTRELPL
jgi:3-oxoacyl-[acyl-carrier protein] reductase